jgi:hypothetical protein
MKKIIAFIIFFYIAIIVYADNEYELMEGVLYDRGYTKFDPKEYFYIKIYDDCYTEIFRENLLLIKKTGIKSLRLDIDDGFIYNLFFPIEKEECPNILVIVYLYKDGKSYGYYKKNLLLEGNKIDTTTGELFVFY